MRVLIVDDSSTMRSLLRMHMKRAGFEVVEAKDGVEALSILPQAGALDLMLLDWNMPNMSGLEVLTSVRAQQEYDSMRIMMVTTEIEIGGVSAALKLGANEYLMKPFSADAVLSKLEILGLKVA